jgi:hypothetical protein
VSAHTCGPIWTDTKSRRLSGKPESLRLSTKLWRRRGMMRLEYLWRDQMRQVAHDMDALARVDRL